MENIYSLLIDDLNKARKSLFKQMIDKVISVEEFQIEAKGLEKEFEDIYVRFISEHNIILSSKDILYIGSAEDDMDAAELRCQS